MASIEAMTKEALRSLSIRVRRQAGADKRQHSAEDEAVEYLRYHE